MTNRTLAVWFSIFVLAAVSLYSLMHRYRVETRNKAVCLVAEADQIESLAAAEGLQFEQALVRLKESGLGGLVVGEHTIGDLLSTGELSADVAYLPKSKSPVVKLAGNPETMYAVERGLATRFASGVDSISVSVRPDGKLSLTVLNRSLALLRTVSAGLEKPFTVAASLAGLEVVARLANPVGASDPTIQKTVDWAREEGARYFLPVGDQVLGRRGGLEALSRALERNQILYASPEFAKIGGDANMVGKHPERVIRLHAAQTAEVDKLDRSGYLERYAKAASDRNIRMLLLRPLDVAGPEPFENFANLIASVRGQIEKEGGRAMPAHPFEEPGVPQWVFAAIGIATAPIALFVCASFGFPRWSLWALGLLFAILGAGCWLPAPRSYVALLASLALPIAAFQLLPSMPKSVAVRYVLISAVSFVGGLAVAGLLNGLPYMVRADQFSGVKLAVFAPVAIVGAWFFFRLAAGKDAIGLPMRWSQAAIGLLVVAILGFMLLRTGNENPAGVSGIELQVRSLLERFLVVRPRTKEFFIGHPALIVGLCLLARCHASEAFRQKWAGWTAMALMLGAIGQTSIVNTMTHLHTPLAIGFVRVGIGLTLGGLFGFVVWQVVRPMFFNAKGGPTS